MMMMMETHHYSAAETPLYLPGESGHTDITLKDGSVVPAFGVELEDHAGNVKAILVLDLEDIARLLLALEGAL